MFVALILVGQFIVETWNWTSRVSTIGVWDASEVTRTYDNMQSAILTNIALATASLFLLCIPSYAENLNHKAWSTMDFKKLLALMTLTGGTVYAKPTSNKYCLRYYGKSMVLHQIFCGLVQRIYNTVVEPARWTRIGSYMTQIYRREIVEDLLTLSPSYNSRNGSHECLKHNDPRADFLKDAPVEVVKEGVRLLASSNGCIRYTAEPISGNNGHYHVRPYFAVGYLSAVPLLDDYQDALNRFGIDTTEVMDKRFGRGYLLGRSWDVCRAFSSIGGFIEGVRIKRGRLEGLKMSDVLLGLLDFGKNENNKFATREEALRVVEECIRPPDSKHYSASLRSDESEIYSFSGEHFDQMTPLEHK
jgi:hypothetical protein